jgi:hypothetical protein
MHFGMEDPTRSPVERLLRRINKGLESLTLHEGDSEGELQLGQFFVPYTVGELGFHVHLRIELDKEILTAKV